MALTYSEGLENGTKAPDFSLMGVDEKTYTLDTFKNAKLLVLIFTCNHCPYAKASEGRLIAIQKDYKSKGVQLVLINSNDEQTYPEDSFNEMIRVSREHNYPFPYLRDETQEVAKAYHAVCTPDIYVFDEARKLRYNGRIDDNWKDEGSVTRHDLRMVLDALLQGAPITFDRVPSMGCSIKWKQDINPS